MEFAWYRFNLHYYLREKCYGKVVNISKVAKQSFTDVSEFNFYSGVAQILEGQVQKGIVELTLLQSQKDLNLGVLMALLYAHNSSSNYDRDIVHSLETKLKEERKHGSTTSYYYAGLFLSMAEKYEKASEYINKSLKKDSSNLNAIVLKGWNDMCINLNEVQTSILDCFELALNKSDKNIDALFGLAKFKYFAKDHNASIINLDKLIVYNPGQVVPLVEKLKNEFAMQKWEAIYDTIERILMIEPNNIQALKIRIFLALCKNSDYIEAADQLNRFYSVLESDESYNVYQFYNTAQTFSKLCNRSSTVLSQVYRFAQYASEMQPNNVVYLSEIGYQCLLQGKTKDAVSFFKAASKIDSNSIKALCGLTLCQITENGPTEQISQQVELLFEMQGSNKLPILYLLNAKLNHKNPSNAVIYLNNAFETTYSYANIFPYSLQYINKLDPDFLLDVYAEYKKHIPKKPFVILNYLTYLEDGNDKVVANCFKLLETVCNACPGLIPALYEIAKLKFLFGYSGEAQKFAQQISELENTHSGCQLLLAQIYIQQQAYTKAAKCLENCLSYNFKIRDNAMYNFLNGIILKSENKIQEALSSCLNSFNITTNKCNASRNVSNELNIIDKATLYLQIIEMYTTQGQHAEAGKLMQEAIQELSYTTEEGRLIIAKAELALLKEDADKAIDMLKEIKPDQPYYFQAHTKMAHIYLKEKNDRDMFSTCFKEVVSNQPMADVQVMMADAYMSIDEPEEAATSYELALRNNPRNIQLIKKLGNSLVQMHEYSKATAHYEHAIKNVNDEDLKYEYIDLLIKLKQYDKADNTISVELNLPQNKVKSIEILKRRVKLLLLQSKSRELKDPTLSESNITLILTEAKELQTIIVKRIEIDSRGELQEEKQLLSTILCALAKSKSAKEPAIAANLYSEALVYVPRNPETLLALAKLYAQMNYSEKCEQTCAILLNTDPNNESAAVMMADLAFRKADLETAQRHLSQILSVKSMSWEALAQLVEVQWRRGKLSEAEQLLDMAKQELGEQEDAGYYYCAGIYASYSGQPNAALRHLNHCRRSPRWASPAATRMVLLCLSQDAPNALSDTFFQAADEGDTRVLALKTAEKLVAEASPEDRRPLLALLQLAPRQKHTAERVLQDLLPTLTDDSSQDNPYVILAVATAYNIVKQPTRAKNILKRTISSIPWTPEKADGLERCWLEVADNQVNSGRVEAARELLNKILTHNSSCASAYQYLGYLAEKEQNYKLASQNYDKAWVHGGYNNLAVGYKLAHAYLKLKKYPECIVVCRLILKSHPEYPKIKKEIMDKAKANLRT